MDLKEAALLRGRAATDHWYYRSKAQAVEALLRGFAHRTVLDVGAGSAFFSRHLLANSQAIEAWCVDPNYPAESDVIENGKEIHFRKSTAHVEADLVLLMDVLEHVENDVALLREYVGKTPARAIFLISVPAFQFMWSGHDVFLEHKRRYTLSELEGVVEAAGLRIQQSKYFFAGVFPPAVFVRLSRKLVGRQTLPSSDMRIYPNFVNWLLLSLCKIELKLIKRNRWFGLTAFCVAQRV